MKRSIAALALVGAAIAAPLVAAGPAAADEGLGEQVAISTYYSDSVQVCGTNQFNNYVCSYEFATPGSGYTLLPNWWWHGQVEVIGFDASNGTYRHQYFWTYYGGANIQYINGRSTGAL